MREVDFYRCELCGNIIAVVKNGGGTNLVCCGQPMTKLKANSTDAAGEKHVPCLQKIDDNLDVVVGAVAHPMEEKHYIEWIALATDDKIEIKYLKPGNKPEAHFEAGESGTVYAYCNLHGLWSQSFAIGKDVILEGASCSPEFGGCKLFDM
ncbi:desulfoferrodoxin [Megasphaera cerevisiae]|uniref:desulfoferrodoxin n=1 Tax=Megasphaera cerevisiae TaxID=39029 RepID=UPI0009425DF0|nr:desulfoferrodoxin [Megasphaera cerevisiae]OKY53338.1 desulfoferrodoxin [Megasphaera cerevisiae]